MKQYVLFLLSTFAILNAKSFIISDIEFKGLYHLSKNSAYELLSFEKDSYVSEEEIDDSIKSLFKQKYFDDIFVEYFEQNETIIFNFIEKSTVSKISMVGFLDSDEEQQKEFLEIKKGSLLDSTRIQNSKDKIIQALNFKGKIDNIVEVKETQLDNGTTQLEFIVREGEDIIIDSLVLNGVKSLDLDDVESEMSNRESQGLGWLYGRNSGEMKTEELEIDRMRIKDFYMQNGFLDVKVSKPFSDIDFNRYRASLKFNIDEGAQYSIKKIDIQMNQDSVIDNNKTISSFLLQKGDTFNIKRLRTDIQKLKYSVADKGYAFVEINPELDKDELNKTVSIIYHVAPKKKVKIRDVIISGNRATLDRIVRREIYLASGDLYNLTDLKDSQNGLGRLGYFEDIKIDEKRISDSEIDLIVSVKESRTGVIQIGGGYSSYLGLTFDAGINDRNIFGSGINLGFSLQHSSISTNYSVTLTNPRLNDSLYSGSFSINQSKMEYDFYDVEDLGFGLSVGKKFTRNIQGSLGYRYSDIIYSNVDTQNIDIEAVESYAKSSITLGLTYDSTDDYFLPREGLILSNHLEFAGVGGDAEFWKNSLSFNTYKGLEDYIDYDLILRYKSKLKNMKDNGNIPLYESIHMGGVGSVRGYDSYSFPNRDFSEYAEVKALNSFTNSFEMSIPISQKAKLRLTGFVDYGWIGIDDFNMENRGGYGAVIEWISPMAPIQFIFSRPFNDEVGDDISKFEFMMGRRF